MAFRRRTYDCNSLISTSGMITLIAQKVWLMMASSFGSKVKISTLSTVNKDFPRWNLLQVLASLIRCQIQCFIAHQFWSFRARGNETFGPHPKSTSPVRLKSKRSFSTKPKMVSRFSFVPMVPLRASTFLRDFCVTPEKLTSRDPV